MCGVPEDRNDVFEQIGSLLQQAAATPGAHVDADLGALSRSLGLFTSNAAHLHVQITQDQRFEAWIRLGPDNQAEFDKHLDEIDRLLHNFLAATYTLRTHTFRIRDHYPDERLAAEYDARSPFTEPVAKLIQALKMTLTFKKPVLEARAWAQ